MNNDPNYHERQYDLYLELNRYFQSNRARYFMSTPSGNLHHYTTNHGLIGIVNSQGFFASPSFSLNDPKEMNHGLEMIEQTCIELSFNLQASDLERKIAKAVLESEIIKAKRYPHWYPTVILISFSESKDNLSQWRSYADDGNGFVVTIDPAAIDFNTQTFASVNGSWAFYKCEYDPQKQKSIILDYLKVIAKEMPYLDEHTAEDIGQNILIVLWELVSVFKHQSYEDEKEWRVRTSIPPSNRNLELDYYASGKTIKASKLLSIANRNVIRSITMGPRNNPESAELGIQVLLAKSNLNNKNTIQTFMSTAPYR